MSRKVRSILALLMLVLFLGTGAAHALPAEGPDRAPGMLVSLLEWVTSLLGFESPLRPAVEASEIPVPPSGTNGGGGGCDFGGYIDPNGCPVQ